jgi:putative transport protein
MAAEVVAILHRVPEVGLFLALGLGYLLGRISIAGVSLGATVGTLLAALVIGQAGFTIDPLVRSVLFALFIFTVGYRGGPQFFSSFKKAAGPQLLFAIVVAVTGVVTTVVVAKVAGLDKGAAGGMLAGALTQSPALGTTADAVSRLGLAPDRAKALTDSATVAYAVTYLFGQFGLLVFARSIAPVLLGVNLKQAAADLERATSHDGPKLEPGQLLAYHTLAARAYRATQLDARAKTVRDLEALIGDRVLVARVHRKGPAIPATPELMLQAGDVIGLIGLHETLADTGPRFIGPEVDDPEALGIVLQTVDVVVTNGQIVGRPLADLARELGGKARGVTIASIYRMQQSIPVGPATVLERGDLIRLVGDERRVAAVAERVGYADWPSDKSDLVMLGLGVVAGTLVGLITVNVFGVPITLGTGGGVLVAGLVLGWLRAKHPTFGRLPPAAQWILSDFGLNAFTATIGLSTGAQAVQAIAQQGLTLFLGGVAVTLVPLIVGTYFGKLILKMNPVILCGALAGAETNAGVLSAVSEVAESSLPVLGFTLPYAVNNMLLTIAAPIIVALV